MSIEENVQIVKDFFAAMGRGDRQGLMALSAEDIEMIPFASLNVRLRRERLLHLWLKFAKLPADGGL